MSKRMISVLAVLSVFVLFAAVSAPAQTAAAPAAAPVYSAAPAYAGYSAVNNGYVMSYPSQYVTPNTRPGSFRDFFGFDGIPFNGSHMAAFQRWRAGR